MGRFVLLLLAGMLAASPSWASLVGPCDPTTPIPIRLEIAPPFARGSR
jgi:hypothetical protein